MKLLVWFCLLATLLRGGVGEEAPTDLLEEINSLKVKDVHFKPQKMSDFSRALPLQNFFLFFSLKIHFSLFCSLWMFHSILSTFPESGHPPKSCRLYSQLWGKQGATQCYQAF